MNASVTSKSGHYCNICRGIGSYLFLLKVLDQITFLTTRLTSTFLRFWYQKMAHIFLIPILKFGVPKLSIYREIIKNVSNIISKVRYPHSIKPVRKFHFLLLLLNKIQICIFFNLHELLK